jgi:nitroreductase
MDKASSVSEAVATRRSVRAFRNQPVSLELVRRVLEKARMAPSGCNFQPWEATVLTGEPLKALQQRLLGSAPDDPLEYDFSAPGALPHYSQRLAEVGSAMYSAMGIVREDAASRQEFVRRNLVSFDAPVLLLCHFPKLMKEPQWSDVGMWLQTIMLLLREEGLDTCPQEYMGVYGRTIKAELGLGDDIMLFCGLAIGWRDDEAPINTFDRNRVPLDDQVRFLGF